MDVSRACDVMLVAGSSLEVLPAAGLPRVALESRAKIIVINKTPTYINPRATVVLSGDVAKIIPQIVSEVLHE
jgi:NAD-dependent deacetylase